MASDNETVADIVREKREKADDIERDADNQYARELVSMIRAESDRIEAACKSDTANLRRRLKVAEDALEKCKTAMCNYCRSTPEAKGVPCLNGCETLAIAKNALATIRGEGESEAAK